MGISYLPASIKVSGKCPKFKFMNKEIINYKETDEYKLLIEDSQSILTEGIFRSRQELIDTYKELGKRITTDPLYKKWGQKTQGKFMQSLAQDIGNSIQVLYYAGQFYERLTNDKEFSTAVEKLGKNASWSKIRALLPEPKKVETPELPEGKYQVIYADPPWEYDVDLSSGATRSPTNNYPVMDLQALKNFGEKVKEISHKDCILFMWITAPKLNWMNDVLEAWGFGYKTNLIWDKIKPNMGHYSSVRHEILVIAGKGTCSPICDGKTIQSIDSVQSIEKSARHSEKPKEFVEIIDKLYPDYKKIELFARNKEQKKNWSYWGNESDGN